MLGDMNDEYPELVPWMLFTYHLHFNGYILLVLFVVGLKLCCQLFHIVYFHVLDETLDMADKLFLKFSQSKSFKGSMQFKRN